MAWGKAGSTTLSSGGDLITVDSLSNNKCIMILNHVFSSGQGKLEPKLNNDGTVNYTSRYGLDGATDAQLTSSTDFENTTGGFTNGSTFHAQYLVNIATEEKLLISHSCEVETTGTSGVPRYRQYVGKWRNTTDAVSRYDVPNVGTGAFKTGSNSTLIGSDITPRAAIPAIDKVQDGSLFVEKENAKRYWGTNKVTTEAVYTSVTGQSTYEKLSGTAQAYSSEKAGVELVSTANDGKAIKIGKWKLAREGTLSGLAYMKVEDGSGNLKATSTGVDVSSITARTSGYEYVTFTLPTAVKVYNGYRVYIEYTTADGSGNFLAFGEFYNGSTTIPTGFEFTIYNKRDSGGNNPSGGWADDGLPTLLIPDAIFDDVPASNVTSDTVTWFRPTRAVFAGKTSSVADTMDYITIDTLGNATDFGDLSYARGLSANNPSNGTRGVYGTGSSNLGTVLDYITIASLGNATTFGNNTQGRSWNAGLDDQTTRGVYGGGDLGATTTDIIDYITIATTGNASDFGDLSASRSAVGCVSTTTRGVFTGGTTASANTNIIDYITIATTGNATDFGDCTVANAGGGGVDNNTRGVFWLGYDGSAPYEIINYITIETTGNASDFGDLLTSGYGSGAADNKTRGVKAGGSGDINNIEYFAIDTTGNATDFGDLTTGRFKTGGVDG